MPDEVDGVRSASGNATALKTAIGEADEKFAASLTAEELAELSGALK